MEASNTNVEGEVTAVRQRHLLGVKLLKPIHVLGTGRPSITLDQAGIVGILLLRFVVNTCGGSVEEIAAFATTCRLKHIHGNGRIIETQDTLVRANKSHATHVSGEVVHLKTVLTRLNSHLKFAQVGQDELIAKFVGFHEFILFPINDGDLVSVFFEAFGDVRADEAGSTANADFGAIAWGEGECFVVSHGESVCCWCCCCSLQLK
mmetsp:Transcript_14550/g.31623  ORF Transcript_14550/g.31623 Transcript_14550/m.31623 type:complete len:206 (-) Transcript_14550:4-621(-)